MAEARQVLPPIFSPSCLQPKKYSVLLPTLGYPRQNDSLKIPSGTAAKVNPLRSPEVAMMLCTFPGVPRCTAWMEETGGQQSLFQHQEIRTVNGSTAHTASPICNSQWQCWGPRLPSFQLLWKTTNAQMLSFGDQTAGGQAAGNTHAVLWRYMVLSCKMLQCFPPQL